MIGLIQHSETGIIHTVWLRPTDGGGPGDELDMIELPGGGEVDHTTPVP